MRRVLMRPICYGTRRGFGCTLAAGLVAACTRGESETTESAIVAKARQYALGHLPPARREPLIRTAAEVERYYTTAPVRVRLRDRIYEVPANYYSAAARARFQRFAVPGADRYDIAKPSEGLGQLHFLWPDFGGYTTDNWYDPLDRREITYSTSTVVPPETPMKTTAQTLDHLKQFGLVETEPSVELYGLRGHRFSKQRRYLWVGERADGQPFTMRSFHPGQTDAVASLPNPQCDVRLIDARTREEVAYRYSLKLFAHWREIDSRTRASIDAWRVQ